MVTTDLREHHEAQDGADLGYRPDTEAAIAALARDHRRFLHGEIDRRQLWRVWLGPLHRRLTYGPNRVDDYRRQLDPWPTPPPDVVLTTYFASRPDPQTGAYVPREELDYIAPWYHSMRSTGAFGIVFHDHLSPGFVARHATDRIRFLRVRLGRFNLNDERFLLYLGFLVDFPSSAVFMTDATDVTITRSPFPLPAEDPGAPPRARIFVGRDRFNLLGHSGWMASMARSIERLTGHKPLPGLAESAMYNAGVVGGPFYPTLFLLVAMVRRFLEIASPEEHDMFVLNEAIYRHFRGPSRQRLFAHPFLDLDPLEVDPVGDVAPAHLGNEVIPSLDRHSSGTHVRSGFPFCSPFGEHQLDCGATFVHK